MPAPLRLDLPVLLPDAPDAQDACVGRLTDALGATAGVERAHVVPPEGGRPAQLCLHYDPAVVALPRLRRAAEAAGARVTERYGHVLWAVDGLGHQRRARTVTERLQQAPGVVEAEANATGPVRIEFDREATGEAELRRALADLGVTVTATEPPEVAAAEGGVGAHAGHDHGPGEHAAPPRSDDEHAGHDHAPGAHAHAHGGIFGERTELVFALLAGVCVGAGWALDVFTGVAEAVPFALFLGAYAFGGWFTVREAWDSIRAGRFEIDFLMIVAAAGAAALGEWFEGGLLLALFSLGHALEGYAMGRARAAIEALGELAPATARVRRGGVEAEVPVGDLQVGDTVVVRPDERIAADGVVVRGTSAVDQAPVTGESVPVDKRPASDLDAALAADEPAPEHRVFAGTLNGAGALDVVVTRPAGETTLARVVQLVAEAETERSPTQRFTDRFEKVFVPSVLVLVALLIVGPPALDALGVITESFSVSFYRAMAVLVAASPCALAIATPSAVLSGVARAGRSGVLVKGGGPLEALGGIEAVAFDKTGTLTEGEPRVTDVVPAAGATKAELVAAVVAVERLSEHPLARAVVRDLGDRAAGGAASGGAAEDLQSVTGHGVRATLGGEPVEVGKPALFTLDGGAAPPAALLDDDRRLKADGRSTMLVRRGARFLGVVGLMDTPRESAEGVIRRLHALGIETTVMISGDAQVVAESVARAVGIDEARGDLLPADKVEAIKRLRERGGVAMVGDGVNDAPALANATVGIAMGAAGSDVALETADVALMADDLARLPFAVGLSRKTRGIIRQNLWLSLGMVAFLVPATIFGLGIGPAVALHEGSTLVVVFNALRLLAYRE
ncbi:heavy metal translocating P-type ATPase [Rubrivirga sp. S365]|uniref:Heavy metal translocating P-type ATPase n=1 Tax=Rubrivirga litoralis TaxID=3075598 RepID=A0ABU3BTE2_9BACT|nr:MULTISPECIES: heavy metal translocating P-type ATPase [unclassified Rubrivirga]MDT0632566.1 heavy metal translocating P-type ATPase [Rubrivirga sp. F394]MDT7856746.1 heavy metal translocating P-type ATPase [Rubrivirga sp. S365]